MPLTVLIKLKEKRPLDITVREWPQILRESHEEVGRFWHEKILPRHFGPGAERVYHYRRRTKKYRDYKAESGHGTVDLVWSGTLQTSLTEHATVKGFPSRVRVEMNGPKYIPKRPRTNKQPPLYEEVTRVTKTERKELAAILKQAILRRITAKRGWVGAGGYTHEAN
ncbi:MAG: hypothetical protein AB7O62_00380 [Pirellulales bacterium]